MTNKEAKKILRDLVKEENHIFYENYIFQNSDFILKIQRKLNGYAFLVWNLDDEKTWNHDWKQAGTQKQILNQLNTYGFIED